VRTPITRGIRGLLQPFGDVRVGSENRLGQVPSAPVALFWRKRIGNGPVDRSPKIGWGIAIDRQSDQGVPDLDPVIHDPGQQGALGLGEGRRIESQCQAGPRHGAQVGARGGRNEER